ncbi:DUF262 domain-containing protein [Salsipaludibacter albus]|uniref:DUF262 domain-containing protein n=1 Tax=Salsipaludibacter albus TaxID=2849650 RepID=UPI001EE3E398|nr:DUF262 domain-containing protein [Salsipaludibacter albus]MBY5163445.1 DUF262 domain-containing protein [Salsipaludibacter albus]
MTDMPEAPDEYGELGDLEEDVLDVDPDEEVLELQSEITAYGADYPVDGLVKRLNQKDIIVPTFYPNTPGIETNAFQRQFVWSKPQMDKFIESLLLGYPVPGIFLVRERTGKLLVLDGQQRLRTLQHYVNGTFRDKTYRLSAVQDEFENRSYSDLPDIYRRRLDDSIIHATILRQDDDSSSLGDSIYAIFERLNTGGSILNPQEIRIALYHGPFLSAIAGLNENEDWRDLYGNRSPRFKDQELILRTLALFERGDRYSRPLKGFLNDYAEDNRSRGVKNLTPVLELFSFAARILNESVGRRAFRPVRAINAAVLDSLLVGVMVSKERIEGMTKDEFVSSYDALIGTAEYTEATTSSTAAEEAVETRLRLAREAFAE